MVANDTRSCEMEEIKSLVMYGTKLQKMYQPQTYVMTTAKPKDKDKKDEKECLGFDDKEEKPGSSLESRISSSSADKNDPNNVDVRFVTTVEHEGSLYTYKVANYGRKNVFFSMGELTKFWDNETLVKVRGKVVHPWPIKSQEDNVFLLPAREDQDGPKDKDKDKGGPVTALPPSDLDGAFEKATNTREIDEGLLNNALYKKAVAEALKAKQEQQKKYVEDPKLVGPTPAQAARQRFLEVLEGGTVEDKDKEPKAEVFQVEVGRNLPLQEKQVKCLIYSPDNKKDPIEGGKITVYLPKIEE
jgi:hypothetical protein